MKFFAANLNPIFVELLVESELVRMKVIPYSTVCLLFVEYDDSFEALFSVVRNLFHLHEFFEFIFTLTIEIKL